MLSTEGIERDRRRLKTDLSDEALARGEKSGRSETDPASGVTLGKEQLSCARMRQVQSLCRSAEAQLFHNGNEIPKMTQLHGQPYPFKVVR
jgi:hypothetical protein